MSQTQPAVLLEHYLKTLRLPTMHREHAKLAAVCQAERADYATYLRIRSAKCTPLMPAVRSAGGAISG